MKCCIQCRYLLSANVWMQSDATASHTRDVVTQTAARPNSPPLRMWNQKIIMQSLESNGSNAYATGMRADKSLAVCENAMQRWYSLQRDAESVLALHSQSGGKNRAHYTCSQSKSISHNIPRILQNAAWPYRQQSTSKRNILSGSIVSH